MLRPRDVGIAVVVAAGATPVLGWALWRLPLAALEGVLAGLAAVAAACAWGLRRADEGDGTRPVAWRSSRSPRRSRSSTSRGGWRSATSRGGWRSRSRRTPSRSIPPPSAARSRRTGTATWSPADLGDVLRRLDVLEARQAWLDGGIADLEAYAQTGGADGFGDDERTL